ncbi:unnamed protein product [Paramecium sonneborni]|uniref:HECT domain-containing protein n=2 Tax=Paramecium sonneborni TaxID=65129 RepID=A0A8S1P8F8_9CILI|nr:unnamed protein product [Paramecium sonneborni]
MQALHQPLLEEQIINEITEDEAQIFGMIDQFNIEELRNFIKDYQKRDKMYLNKQLFEHLVKKIKETLNQIIIELQNNSKYDCSLILDFIYEFFKNPLDLPLFNHQFSFQEDLLKIIEFTDCLLIYEKVFQLFYLLPQVVGNISNYYFPRLIHLEKILYEHINYLTPKKINLIDYFQEDPKYEDNRMNLRNPLQFDIEYNEPTQLEESYEDICKNNIHNYRRLQGQFQNKKVEILDDDSISALALSRNLLNKNNEPISPLIEIVKYRILIKRGLNINPQITKNIIIKLHQNVSIMIQKQRSILNQLNEDIQDKKVFFNSIIKDVRNTDYFNLFKLETIDPLLVIQLIKTLSETNQYQKLLSDVLSMKHIEQDELTQGYPLKYYPQIFSENFIRNEQLTCSIFQSLRNLLICKQLSEDDYNEIIRPIIRSLNIEDNRMLLQPKQLVSALQLLGYLIKNHDPHINSQNLDVLLQITELYINKGLTLQKPAQEGYTQINETDADIIMNACFEVLNYFLTINSQNPVGIFGQNQLNNDNTDFIRELTLKISNSNVLVQIANKLQQQQYSGKTIINALNLISSLLKANFQLIYTILNSKLPNILNEIILRMNTEELNLEITLSIISFYANLTRREEFKQFIEYGKRFLELIINYQLITQENTDYYILLDLAKSVVKYYSINDKSNFLIHEILVKVLGQLLEQLKNLQQSLNFNQDFESKFKMIQKKKIQILLFNREISVQNQSLCQYLQQNGYFDMLSNLFKIPCFNQFIVIKGFNSAQCSEKALRLIDEWEKELGCPLEQATQLSFNQTMLLEDCSIQTYQIASRFTEIIHYLSQLVQEDYNFGNFLIQSDKLIDKCCALLEIALFSENASNVLFRILQQSRNSNMNNLQSISRLLIRFIFESNNHPSMTLKLLQKINFFFVFFNTFQQEINQFLINSQFGNHLQNVIKNYIVLINTDSSNKQLINDLGNTILQILKQLYTIPLRRNNLLIIPKIISDIVSLIQITKNSTKESIKEIQEFLLIQANKFASPTILQQINITQEGNKIMNIFTRYPQIINGDQFNKIFTQDLDTLNSQINEQILQQIKIKAQQESIRLLFKENIELISNFDVFSELYLQLNLSEILRILQLSAQKQFNLNLQFMGFEIEMSNQPDYNLKSIILALSSLYKLDQQQYQQSFDSILRELLKLLDVLLQQVDQLKIKAVNFTLAFLSNLITENQESLSLILKGVQKTLDSDVQNQITFQICIDILVNIFQKNSLFVNQFVYQMRGLESVFKVKGDSYNHFISLTKLTLAIIYDKTIIRAQIEAKIKKIIFDQENQKQVKIINQQQDLQYYQNQNAFPICQQPTQYNVQTQEQYKIQKNHPALQFLQNNQNYQEDITDIMNLLFNEQVENNFLILKQGFQLDTLNTIKQNGNAIQQFNFKHKNETQILLKLLVEQIIIQYFDNNQEQKYYWKILFDVLQFLISKFPLLLPQILRMNCSQFLQKFKINIGYENSQLPTKISFLTLITKFIIPPKDFMFCICLDTLVVIRKQNKMIVPFGYDIRRLIIKQLYVEINKSINSQDDKILNQSNMIVTLLQIKSVAKICILNIKEPQNSFNFIKLYIDGIKNFNYDKYFIKKDQIFFMIKTLNVLYNVATSLLLEKTEPIINHSFDNDKMELRIIGQINPEETNCQLFQSDQINSQIFKTKNWNNEQFQYYLQNWPFLQIKNGQFQENIYQNREQEIPIDILQIIPEINNSQEICTQELVEEFNSWTDELDQSLEQETQNTLEIDNNFTNFMKGVTNQILENQIQITIKFEELHFPCQFQINLQEFKHQLPLQNNIQLIRNYNEWQQDLYPNNSNDQIQNIDQNFGNFQDQQNQIINQFVMGHQNNQSRVDNSQIQHQAQNQFQKIKNIVNSAQRNRKQTLKHLGEIDQQLIQQIFLIFFYVDDDIELNYDFINAFLISLGTKANFHNQIIQQVIKTLNMTTQNQRQENVNYQSRIISRNQRISDHDQTINFVQNKALKLLNQLLITSSFNISEENVKQLIELLLQGKHQKEIFQFLVNQEQKYHLILTPAQVQKLYNLMIEQKDIQNRINYINLISQFLHNTIHFMAVNKIKIKRISEYYNSQFFNKQQIVQPFKEINELEQIFQMIYIISSKGEQERNLCQEFLNSDQLISSIQNLSDSRLLPILKVFLICYQNQSNTQNLPLLRISSMEISQTGSTERLIDFEKLFKNFCLNGRAYINHIVKEQIYNINYRQNTNNINNNDLIRGILNFYPQVIDFQNKKDYLYANLLIINSYDRMLIRVRKSQIFQDSYQQIIRSSPYIFKHKLFEIRYVGEMGQDAGGLTTDWIEKLSYSILDEQNQLFIPNDNKTWYLINSESLDPNHLQKFKFVGMFLAIAIICKVNILSNFPIYFYKHIVGQKLSRSDIQYYDEGVYNAFDVIYNSQIDSNWDLYWLYTINRGGKKVDKELKPGGQDIEVTENDKKDFVRKYCHQIMAKDIEEQIKAIQQGFYSLIPKEYIKIFDSTDLEQLLCGQSYVDVEDLIKHLNYQGFTSKHQVIGWLQNTLRSYNQDMLVKFLKFTTSRTRIPIGGFENQECRITVKLLNYLQTDIDSRYPQGHTCTHTIDMPPYSNQQILQKRLEEALLFQGETFDLV